MKILEKVTTRGVAVRTVELGTLFKYQGQVYARCLDGLGRCNIDLGGYNVLVFSLSELAVCEMDQDTLVTPLPNAVLCPEGLPEGGQS